jgi:RNA-binding protein YhbY
MVQKAEANSAFIGNKGHCEPLIKEILEELKELITLGELRKLTRTETISFEDFHKKRVPNKSLVKELKRALDPKELIEERVTIKRSLRSSGFRIPKQISSTELVQLARKRGLL